MTLLTREDGLTALGEAHQASREWGSSAMYPRWKAELIDLIAPLPRRRQPSTRWVLPVYDGDPPDEPVGARYTRQYQRDALSDALFARDDALHRTPDTAVRATHRAVHQALADDDTSACRWCR